MTRDDTLLTDAYRQLARDWPAWTTGTYLSDDYGRFAFRAQHAGTGRYLAFIKANGLHHGQASFMAKGVRCARHESRWLVLFCAEQPSAGTARVFHPETVDRSGEPFTIGSKKRVQVEAVQLDAREHGVLLGDLLSGRAEPPVPESADPTKPTTLRMHGIDRSEV